MLLIGLTSGGCGAGLGLEPEVKPIAKAPILKDPPKWVMEQCASPRALPRKEMTQKEIEDRWGADVDAAEDCRARHAILLRYYKSRDYLLRAPPLEQAGK